MSESIRVNQQKQIHELEKGVAVMQAKMDAVTQGITEIKTNHLVHINDQLATISTTLSEITITIAKREPGSNILNKVIEYAIMAILAGVIALVITR